MCGGSRNRPSTKAVEEVVSPGEIHTPNITGSNEKGGKRLEAEGEPAGFRGWREGGREMEQQKF